MDEQYEEIKETSNKQKGAICLIIGMLSFAAAIEEHGRELFLFNSIRGFFTSRWLYGTVPWYNLSFLRLAVMAY